MKLTMAEKDFLYDLRRRDKKSFRFVLIDQ